MIKPNGFIALEIGYDQAQLMESLARENSLDLDIIKDYSGNDRVAVFKHK